MAMSIDSTTVHPFITYVLHVILCVLTALGTAFTLLSAALVWSGILAW